MVLELQLGLCVYVYMCAHVCADVCTSLSTCGGQRSTSRVLSPSTSFDTGSFTEHGIHWARLARQGAPGIPTSISQPRD